MDVKELCLGCMSFVGNESLCPYCGYREEKYFKPYHLKPGTFFDRDYLIGRYLEENSYFISYIGYDLKRNRKVVLKEYFPKDMVERDVTDDEEGLVKVVEKKGNEAQLYRKRLKDFGNESLILLQLERHPGIVPVRDYILANNTGYRIREYVSGEKLKNYLARRNGFLAYEELLSCIEPLINGIKSIHERGVIHGNISSDKIYLDETGKLKLLDFGNARFVGHDNAENEVLKEGYAASEQYLEQAPVGVRTDIYSLGSVIYHILTGQAPPSAIERPVMDTIKKPSELNISMPRKAEKALMKALSVKSEKRHKDVDQFFKSFTAEKEQRFPWKQAFFSLSVMTLFVAGIFLFNMFSTKEEKEVHNLAVTVKRKTILRLHGSNTIGASLAPDLAKKFLKNRGAEKVFVERMKNPVEKNIVGRFNDYDEIIEIKAHGSSTSFKSLLKNQCNVGMSSRVIKDKEVSLFEQIGVDNIRSVDSEHVLAIDGIAVIVNKSNPVRQLSVSHLRDIFSGKITNWSDLGGEDLEINLYSRDGNSGTFEVFKKLVLQGETLSPTAELFEDNARLSDTVSVDSSGIGFVGLPYIRNSQSIAVYDGNSDPLFPTVFSVATEDYVLSRRLYLYMKTGSSKIEESFISFALSQVGQKAVEDAGFVSLMPHLEDSHDTMNKKLPWQYRQETKNAKRLSINFRFKFNSKQLDNKAQRDIGRVIQFFSRRENRTKSLRLIGFSDNIGAWDANMVVSRVRAEIVADEFRKRGITVSVSAYGSAVPVAPNDTLEGREKNRRVELWVAN